MLDSHTVGASGPVLGGVGVGAGTVDEWMDGRRLFFFFLFPRVVGRWGMLVRKEGIDGVASSIGG